MRLTPACPLVAALVLALQFPAHASPQAHAADATPIGQSDKPAPVRVVLVRPVGADPITAEALFRIRGELTAEGFTVVVVDAPTNTPGQHEPGDGGASETSSDQPAVPSDQLSDAGAPADRPSGAGAPVVDAEVAQTAPIAVTLSIDTSTHVAELVVVDRLQRKKLTRWIDTRNAPADHLAEVLAVRAVELVRASLVELELPVSHPSDAPAPPAKVRDPSWGLEAGMSALASPGGVDPAALPLARVRFAPLRQLELRLACAGLGTSPRVDGPNGTSARVTPALGLFEIALRPWPDLRVRPSLSLDAGVLEVSAEGVATSPYLGKQASTWSALLGGGAGAEVLVGPHFGIAAEVHALAAIPYPVVRFLGQDAGRVATPGVLASFGLVGWL